MHLTYNIPMFSILLVLMSAMVIPFFSPKELGIESCSRSRGGGGRPVGGAAGPVVRVRGELHLPDGPLPGALGELALRPPEALLALVFSVVMILSLCAGAEDIRRDVRADRQGSYCVLMQLLFGALLAMIYTDDLFTAYVFIEIAAVTACMAVVAKESGRSVVSAIRYLIFSCLGSGLVLLGIALLYCITGQLLFSSLEQAVMELVASRTYTLPLVVSALLMTLGLSIKKCPVSLPRLAARCPRQRHHCLQRGAVWSGAQGLPHYSPETHPASVRPVSAGHHLHGRSAVSPGSDGYALCLGGRSAPGGGQEHDRLLLSAQISYIFLGLGLGTDAGLIAACYQILAHAMTKSMIFSGAGAMIRASNRGHYWSQLRGAAGGHLLGGLAFTVGGLSLCGLPLLAGFSAKYCLAIAALDAQWQTARPSSAWRPARCSMPCTISPPSWPSGAGGGEGRSFPGSGSGRALWCCSSCVM